MDKEKSGLIDLSCVYMFLFSLRFSEVFWVVFLCSKGLSFGMIGLLETIFHMTSMAGEVPTGLIADRYGRKASLAAGRFLAALSGTVILLARDWRTLAGAFALNALSYTCHSGAYEALVYDDLPPEKRAEFSQTFGKVNSIYLAGTSIATIFAGILGHRSLEILYVLTIAVDLSCAIVSLFMTENRGRARTLRSTGSATESAAAAELAPESITESITVDTSGTRDTKTGLLTDLMNLVETLKRPDLRRLLVLWEIVSALVTSVKFYGRSFLKESMIPLFTIAAADTAGNLLAIVPTRNAHKIEKRFGQIPTLSVGSLLVSLIVILMALTPTKTGAFFSQAALVFFYLGLTILNETLYPIFSNAVNSQVDSRNRAAVLSSGSMLFSLLMIAVFPAIGFLADRVGLALGMAVPALFIGLIIVLLTVPRYGFPHPRTGPYSPVSS